MVTEKKMHTFWPNDWLDPEQTASFYEPTWKGRLSVLSE
ncbi:hypothetical protein ADIAL_0164 [Alkalibacterium sp. AK22]|nr:hypothetical protein ADIAL_0164 [Alkalibacterium sp. AK22]